MPSDAVVGSAEEAGDLSWRLPFVPEPLGVISTDLLKAALFMIEQLPFTAFTTGPGLLPWCIEELLTSGAAAEAAEVNPGVINNVFEQVRAPGAWPVG